MLRSVNGVRINVLDEGEGHPVLFLHGLGGCWRDWEPQLDRLADRYRCVAIEHRGHGRSEATTGRYSTALFAADAVAVCRDLGIEHAHVVGLSMGGLVAQHVALAAPDLVDALVLCDTGAWMPPPMAAALLGIAAEVQEKGFADSRGVVTTSALAWAEHTLAHHPELVRSNQRETEGTDPDVWANAARAVTEHDTRADLPAITAPTLLVWGEEDRLIPVEPAATQLRDGLPASELVVVPDAGHLVNLEQPEAFDRALTAFLDAHPCGR
ncbi:MAG TPA: alpha/beta fold hydrolase [Acidimicrobiales bacterium]